MGHVVNPILLRIGVVNPWISASYSRKNNKRVKYIIEDFLIYNYIRNFFFNKVYLKVLANIKDSRLKFLEKLLLKKVKLKFSHLSIMRLNTTYQLNLFFFDKQLNKRKRVKRKKNKFTLRKQRSLELLKKYIRNLNVTLRNNKSGNYIRKTKDEILDLIKQVNLVRIQKNYNAYLGDLKASINDSNKVKQRYYLNLLLKTTYIIWKKVYNKINLGYLVNLKKIIIALAKKVKVQSTQMSQLLTKISLKNTKHFEIAYQLKKLKKRIFIYKAYVYLINLIVKLKYQRKTTKFVKTFKRFIELLNIMSSNVFNFFLSISKSIKRGKVVRILLKKIKVQFLKYKNIIKKIFVKRLALYKRRRKRKFSVHTRYFTRQNFTTVKGYSKTVRKHIRKKIRKKYRKYRKFKKIDFSVYKNYIKSDTFYSLMQPNTESAGVMDIFLNHIKYNTLTNDVQRNRKYSLGFSKYSDYRNYLNNNFYNAYEIQEKFKKEPLKMKRRQKKMLLALTSLFLKSFLKKRKRNKYIKQLLKLKKTDKKLQYTSMQNIDDLLYNGLNVKALYRFLSNKSLNTTLKNFRLFYILRLINHLMFNTKQVKKWLNLQKLSLSAVIKIRKKLKSILYKKLFVEYLKRVNYLKSVKVHNIKGLQKTYTLYDKNSKFLKLLKQKRLYATSEIKRKKYLFYFLRFRSSKLISKIQDYKFKYNKYKVLNLKKQKKKLRLFKERKEKKLKQLVLRKQLHAKKYKSFTKKSITNYKKYAKKYFLYKKLKQKNSNLTNNFMKRVLQTQKIVELNDLKKSLKSQVIRNNKKNKVKVIKSKFNLKVNAVLKRTFKEYSFKHKKSKIFKNTSKRGK
uniref:Mp26-like protein n=1 Tax=Cavenderia fasciculata TaxID=261658 RepID=B2XX95_CACFS|nr:Mp26-like protein [Cavenderia fasciculata]ABX45217.1 Mp26-like protein [Cavenderia fasciculata]